MSTFKKVSKEQYFTACGYTEKYGDDLLEGFDKEYEDIPLPKRATFGSAGYDFFLPFSIDLEPNETIVIPTGMRWVVSEVEPMIFKEDGMGVVLQIYPRSGLGFKHQLGMANTIPVIDFDYAESDNEGHIMIKLVNRGDKSLHLEKGKGFAQGVIGLFLTTDDDEQLEEMTKRNGGMGSSDTKEELPSEDFTKQLP